MDRDYSEELTLEMEWGEWTAIWALASQTVIDREESDEWPDHATERDREVVDKLSQQIGEENPGNGMDDWPDSMKKAYNETIHEMMQEEL